MSDALNELLMQQSHYRLHNYQQALMLSDRVIQLAHIEHDDACLATALFLKGEALEKTGQFLQSRRVLEEALAIALKINLMPLLLDINECLGKACYTSGDLNAALSAWGYCLESALDQHSIVHYIKSYVGIGGVYLYFGMIEESLRHHKIAYEYVLELDDPNLLMMLNLWLGSDYCQLGRYELALIHLNICKSLYPRTNDVGLMCEAIMHSGYVHSGLGEYSIAKQCFLQTISLSQRHHHVWSKSMAQLGLAELYLIQGQTQEALCESQIALDFAKQGGSQHQEMLACKIQSAVYEKMGLFEQALISYERHSDLAIQLAKERTFTQIESSTMRKISRMEMRLKLLKAEQQKQNILNDSIRQQAEHLAEKNTLIAINQAKSDFLALISHEIRTPLSGVIGMLRLAQGQKELRVATRSQIRMGLENAELLLGIINDILDASKIESGKLSIEAIPFDLLKLINQVVDFFSVRAEEKGLSFILNIAHFSPSGCLGDPTRIRQILFNLIGNAIKFTENGAVTITAYRDNEQVKIIISDSGIGMDNITLGRLFQKFEQADSSTTRKYGGTGLGLSICRGLVELMHGSLGVTSAPGEGSSFRIEIPLPIAELPPETEEQDTVLEPLSHQIRVLYAEDIQTNQLIVGALLDEMNLSLQIVENGREALAALGGEPFDVVLMDWRMPIMDGMTATRLIRAGGDEQNKIVDSEIYVIGLTANATEKERLEGSAAGMNDYLTKPVSARALHAALAQAIRYQLARGRDLMPMPIHHSVSEITKMDSEQQLLLDALVRQGVMVDDALDRLNGNINRYQRWLKHFLLENQAFFNELPAYLSIAHLPYLISHVHAIRGVAGTLGLQSIYSNSAIIENALNAAEHAQCDLPDFSPLIIAWQLAQNVILPLVNEKNSVVKTDVPSELGLLPEFCFDTAYALQDALQKKSLRAKKIALQLQSELHGKPELIADIVYEIELLNFPSALLALNSRLPVLQGHHHG